MTQQKVVFASTTWIQLAETILIDLVGSHGKPGTTFSVCEVFLNVPRHVDAKGTVAWHFHIDGRSVVVGVGEAENVDMRISADYEEALIAARLVYTPEMVGEREAGPDQPPGYLVELHNRLAVLTR